MFSLKRHASSETLNRIRKFVQFHSIDTEAESINVLFFLRRSIVRLGEWNISSEIDCQDSVCADPVIDIAIRDIFTRYDSGYYDVNNLAVIKLDEEAKYSSNA